MKASLLCAAIVAGALVVPAMAYAADSDKDRSHAETYVKDSAITAKVKSELAEEKLSTMVHISVDTDQKGVVYLSGTARTQADIDRAAVIAAKVKGVTSVKNDIKIKADK
jgi:hyperosmotically inducible protein